MIRQNYLLIFWLLQGFILGPTLFLLNIKEKKLPSKGVLSKRCSENMQHIYRRKSMPKCDFNKVALQLRHGCSPVNLLHIFRTPFPWNTSEMLLLKDLLVTYSIAIYVDNTLICGNSQYWFLNLNLPALSRSKSESLPVKSLAMLRFS